LHVIHTVRLLIIIKNCRSWSHNSVPFMHGYLIYCYLVAAGVQ
jgi:hypothetical protein